MSKPPKIDPLYDDLLFNRDERRKLIAEAVRDASVKDCFGWAFRLRSKVAFPPVRALEKKLGLSEIRAKLRQRVGPFAVLGLDSSRYRVELYEAAVSRVYELAGVPSNFNVVE